MIKNILSQIILEKSKESKVAVLLSGGVDSLSVACCADMLGKKIHAYSFHLENQPSYDSHKAQQASKILGWEFTLVEVPLSNLSEDFLKLKSEYKCVKKTQYECTFPFLYVYPHISENEIISGWAADGHYGISKKAMIHYRTPKSKFDEFRSNYYSQSNPVGVNQQLALSKNYKKTFIAPYMDKRVIDYFNQFDWDEMNKPHQKHHVRLDFKDYFDRIGKIKQHANLQLESGVDHAFEKLLTNNIINYKNRKRMMDVYRDHSCHK